MRVPKQVPLDFTASTRVESLLPGRSPSYSTDFGAAYQGDSLELMKELPADSVNLVFTSPPYALHFKKEYGNVAKDEYINWFLPFAEQIRRIITPDGSFVLNIGGSYEPGRPTRSVYHFRLLLEMVDKLGFVLAQECFWYNPAKMPMPAEWVTVRRERVKDAVEYVWWFAKNPHPKANNRNVLRPYSPDMIRLNQRGVRATVRPSGHNIRSTFDQVANGGAIPGNVIEPDTPTDLLKFGNNAANDQYTKRSKAAGIKIHPARFPAALPEFFVKLLTSSGDVILDPFAGSNTTGWVAEALERRWLSMEFSEEYVAGSRLRFEEG